MRAIPRKFEIDFSPYRKDLIARALSRMLGQHYDKCALKQFVLAIMGEVQVLYDALLDLQEQRTLYKAEGYNLEAIGRIVGEPRLPHHYDERHWMHADRPWQCPDTCRTWTRYAPVGVIIPARDPEYKWHILPRIVKNHTLAASVPELHHLTHMIMDQHVSWDKTGPMQVSVLVPASITPTFWNMLTYAGSDRRVDDMFLLPYPATLWFSAVIIFVPEGPEPGGWFCPDRTNHQRCDRARVAVGVPHEWPKPEDGNIVYPDPYPEGEGGGAVTVYIPRNWLCPDRTNNQQRPDRADCAVGVPYKKQGAQ